MAAPLHDRSLKRSVCNAPLVQDLESLTADEIVSLFALALVGVKERIAVLEHQVLQMRLQMQENGIQLPMSFD
jgi:hypothetical protein